MLKQIHHYSRLPEFEGKLFLIEEYDLSLARKLVTGVDVWLNNPKYPLEACGTSGQKAAMNGGLNLSVLDGWWAEGYDGDNGWAITPHGSRFDENFGNQEEARELMDLLENEVLPLYFQRGGHSYSKACSPLPENLPPGKSGLKSIGHRYRYAVWVTLSRRFATAKNSPSRLPHPLVSFCRKT